jgi:hypothetical protein
MAFIIQTLNARGKWAPARFAGPPHHAIETAVSAACHWDEDGLFPADVRIVDDTGKVIVTAKSWSDENRKRREQA